MISFIIGKARNLPSELRMASKTTPTMLYPTALKKTSKGMSVNGSKMGRICTASQEDFGMVGGLARTNA